MKQQEKPASDFARVRRVGARGAYDRLTIHAILDAAPFCHIGHIIAGRPVVIPTLHWRHGESVYWHGSAASRMLEANAAGGEVCLTASLFDGWVLARSGFHHSVNYRSVMCFGVPRAITDASEKEQALSQFMESRFAGRWATLRPATQQELKATLVLTMPIVEASAKLRAGPPSDDPEDVHWPVWAGVMPVALAFGKPQPAPDMPLSLAEAPPLQCDGTLGSST
jgi:nitroimidazol reductase NimA-like FMN-containing flavoprotein (pyridoxamine 5'-phosphate oxidase superfamily)